MNRVIMRAMDGSAASARHAPLVTLGVPVYNAGRYLARALDSLLGQTLQDFEIIISDNASTDDTGAIGRAYAQRDPRIRYMRQTENIGAPRNWNVLVPEARGRFFKWASGNDWCAPVFLERCVEPMLSDDGIVLAYGQTQLIGEDDRPIRIYDRDQPIADARPSDRFVRVCRQLGLNNLQSGLFRLDVLRRTGLDRLYPGGDLAMIAEVALHGRFHMVPEVLLFRQQGRGAFTSLLTPLALQQVYDPKATRPMKLLRARRHLDHLASIARAPIPLEERVRAASAALRFARWDRVHLWEEFTSFWSGARRAE